MRCTTSFCGTSFRNFDKTLKRPVLLGGVFICAKSGSRPLGVRTRGSDPFSFARGEIAGTAAKHLGLRFSTGGNTHDRSQAIAVGFCADQLDAQALVRRGRALCIVPEQVYW